MFKNLILTSILALTLALPPLYSNAAIITQNIISENQEDIVGSISIDTAGATDEGGGISSVLSFTSFFLEDGQFGLYALENPDPIDNINGDFFYAEFQNDDLSAGIDYLLFDLLDSFSWVYSGEITAGDSATSDYVVYDNNGDFASFFDGLILGKATIENVSVSEPSMLLLFIIALLPLALRKKKI